MGSYISSLAEEAADIVTNFMVPELEEITEEEEIPQPGDPTFIEEINWTVNPPNQLPPGIHLPTPLPFISETQIGINMARRFDLFAITGENSITPETAEIMYLAIRQSIQELPGVPPNTFLTQTISNIVGEIIPEGPITYRRRIRVQLGSDATFTTGGKSTTFLPPDQVLARVWQLLTETITQYSDDEAKDLGYFIIIWMDVPESEIQQVVGVGMKSMKADKKFYIFSPNSYCNCYFTSVALGYRLNKDLPIDGAKINHYGARLKQKAKISNSFPSNEDMQSICNYIGVRIYIYNAIFDIKQILTPRSFKNYFDLKIHFEDNHCSLLIDREWLDQRPNLLIHFKRIAPEEMSDEEKEKYKTVIGFPDKPKCIMPQKEKENPPRDNKLIAWDIETSKARENSKDFIGEQIPYALGVAFPSGEENKCIQFWGEECIHNFISWIVSNEKSLNGYTFYAHNGAKFDIFPLIKECLNNAQVEILHKKCLFQSGGWINFVIRINKSVICFRDSCRLLPASLATLTKDFKVPHQKLAGDVDHDEVTLTNYSSMRQIIEPYLNNDCLGLLEMMQMFSEMIYEKYFINITRAYTAATLSKMIFFKRYYKPESDSKRVYEITEKVDNYIREGYYGGRVESFFIGEINNPVYYYDFTSLYPDVGRENMPVGYPNYTKEFKWGTNGVLYSKIENFGWVRFFGFVRAKVTGTKEMLKNRRPLHGVIENHRLIFPYINSYTELTLFSPELMMGKKMGYKYEIIDGYAFLSSSFLKECFEDLFANKDRAAEQKNDGLKRVFKIIANSLYGFWGFRVKNRDTVEITGREDRKWIKLFNEGRLVNKTDFGLHSLVRYVGNVDVKKKNVAIAAAITSYARMKLTSLIINVENFGEEVYYCDTDSIITSMNITLPEFKSIRDSYQEDGKGKALGTLKNEYFDQLFGDCDKRFRKELGLPFRALPDEDEAKLKVAVSNFAKLQLERESEPFFNRCIICGPKFYYLSRPNSDGTILQICKLKGFSQIAGANVPIYEIGEDQKVKRNPTTRQPIISGWTKANYKLKYEDYKRALEGGHIIQEQFQMHCGINDMLDSVNPFRMRVEYPHKAVFAIKGGASVYTKGIYNGMNKRVDSLII